VFFLGAMFFKKFYFALLFKAVQTKTFSFGKKNRLQRKSAKNVFAKKQKN